jgi:AraC-like DNA-binding protein
MPNYSHEIIKDDSRMQLYFDVAHIHHLYSPLHWHSHLEIIFILEGYMIAYINDRKYTLKKDDILIVNPRELHSTNVWGETVYLLLQIPYDYLSRALENASLIHFQEFFPSITTSASQKKLRDSLLELVKTGTGKEDGYLFHFSSIVYEFLYTLYRHHSQKISPEAKDKKNRNFERMEELLQYVRANYKRDITLKEAASILNISPEYFCRLFKKHTGQTFLEYLNAVRLLHFHRELLSTDYSITELMERNGITNYKVFIRSFKETYGTTPYKLRATEHGF